jgi:hypothetical protein
MNCHAGCSLLGPDSRIGAAQNAKLHREPEKRKWAFAQLLAETTMGRTTLSADAKIALQASAALVLVGAMLSGPIAMLIVSAVAPQPEWTSATVFATHFHQIQNLPYLLGYFLLSGFVLFVASCHAIAVGSPQNQHLTARTSAALVWTAVYASVVFTNYTLQLGFIPRVLEFQPPYLSVLTMANPRSFAWFLEIFGYAALGVATWLVAPLFGTAKQHRFGRVVRRLLKLNGWVSLLGAVCTALLDGFVFTAAGLASFVAWNVLIAVCFYLIAATDCLLVDLEA